MYSRQLESFVQTAKAGSFTKASKELFVSTPSLIQQIDLLEGRLGLKLFERSNKGVTLTLQGESLYRDAVDIIRMSKDAVSKAKRMGNPHPIRVGTSLLMKCRLLPGIWAHMVDSMPNMEGALIEIVQLLEKEGTVGNSIDKIGSDFDVMEGLYLSELYDQKCNFVELENAALGISCPKPIGLSDGLDASSKMLDSISVVTLRRGVSSSFDSMQDLLKGLGAREIIEVPHYDMRVFADCELNNRAIVMPEMWEDLTHDMQLMQMENAPTIPYGLIFAKEPTSEAAQLMRFAMASSQSSPSS